MGALHEADWLHSDISEDKWRPIREERGVVDAYSTLSRGWIRCNNTSARDQYLAFVHIPLQTDIDGGGAVCPIFANAEVARSTMSRGRMLKQMVIQIAFLNFKTVVSPQANTPVKTSRDPDTLESGYSGCDTT